MGSRVCFRPGEPPTLTRGYTFKYPRPPRPRNLRIYECHVGMSSQEPKVGAAAALCGLLGLHALQHMICSASQPVTAFHRANPRWRGLPENPAAGACGLGSAG